MLRKQKKLSQGDLAHKISVSRDSIDKYELGDIMPTADKAKKKADVLGVSINFLMNDSAKEEVVDKDMLLWKQEFQKLRDTEKDKVLSVIDALVRDFKTRKSLRLLTTSP